MGVEISICIVTHNARGVTLDCLNSIRENPPSCAYEILLADNASADGTDEAVRTGFPEVRLLKEPSNMGFSAPNNHLIRMASGRYLVLLNNDTLVSTKLFDQLHDCFVKNPKAGIAGPKVLSRDGSFQQQCRRGFARPGNLLGYYSGLSRLFPGNKLLSSYLLTELPIDEPAKVDAVSGSCMMIRREMMESIGLLDERFFAYQEDSDYCLRAWKAGWEVWYWPAAEVIHLGGMGGSRAGVFRSIWEWHRSFYLYYQKNLSSEYPLWVNALMYVAMFAKLSGTMILSIFRREKRAGSRKP